MIIDELPLDLVNILSFNYESLVKFLIIFLAIFLSLIYLFIIKPNQKKTNILAIGFLRLMAHIYSISSLIVSPFYIFALSPHFPFETLLILMFWFYIPLFVISALLILTDMYIVFPYYLLKFTGFDIKDKRINSLTNMVFKNKNERR